MFRNLVVLLCLSAGLVHPSATAQTLLLTNGVSPTSTGIVSASLPDHLVVIYRNHAVPAGADTWLRAFGARSVHHLAALGLSAVVAAPGEGPALRASLAARPEVASVLEDRIVRGHVILLGTAAAPPQSTNPQPAIISLPAPISSGRLTAPSIFSSIGDSTLTALPAAAVAYDTDYNSPQGWAVRQAGGYGDAVPGGPPAGPWNTSLGAGIRIAVLDSGIDASHPDIAPNLVYQASLIDQSSNGEPSPCDDASPQDQSGHGTWVASLAVGALGVGSGNVIGIAPHASLLSIKVLERLPSGTGVTLAAQCEAGQPGGLLSWVLAGINAAVAQHAGIIVLSLGAVVDLTTGDGAGWKAQFDSAAYAAEQAGAVLVAAVGNDGLDLSGGRYLELPAQARGVLAVVADTNPGCAENLASNAACAPGSVTRAYYSNHGVAGAIAAPGGSDPEGSDTGISGFVRGACSSGLTGTIDGLPGDGPYSFGCFNQGHTPYVQAMGTSAAAPLVAGAIAILRAERPGLTPAQIVSLIQQTASSTTAMAEPQLNLPAALLAQ
jgi:subtilisin family serine protease